MATINTKFNVGDEVFVLTEANRLVKTTVLSVNTSEANVKGSEDTAVNIVYQLNAPENQNAKFGFLKREQEVFSTVEELIDSEIKRSGIIVQLPEGVSYKDADFVTILENSVLDMEDVIAKANELKSSVESAESNA